MNLPPRPLNALPNPEDLVLVVVLNNRRDLEIARLLGWYRIPLKSAPKVIAVDYLALYQTAAFGEEKQRIQYVAPVRGHELTTRAELLKDEPQHPRAHQEYFKVEIGPLVSLPRPILAGAWKRITFLYTTGAYLLQASTLRDLVIDDEERSFLWQALRERAAHSQSYQAQDLPGFDLDPALLAALLGFQAQDEKDSSNHAG